MKKNIICSLLVFPFILSMCSSPYFPNEIHFSFYEAFVKYYNWENDNSDFEPAFIFSFEGDYFSKAGGNCYHVRGMDYCSKHIVGSCSQKDVDFHYLTNREYWADGFIKKHWEKKLYFILYYEPSYFNSLVNYKNYEWVKVNNFSDLKRNGNLKNGHRAFNYNENDFSIKNTFQLYIGENVLLSVQFLQIINETEINDDNYFNITGEIEESKAELAYLLIKEYFEED